MEVTLLQPWIYRDAPITEEQAAGYVGFVYLITNTIDGRRYIGKKLFTKAKTLQPLKGKTRKRRSRVQSDWEKYFGSSDELKADVKEHGPENFTREILRLCSSKAETSYWETYEIFSRHALLDPTYYNKWVSSRINSNQLKFDLPLAVTGLKLNDGGD